MTCEINKQHAKLSLLIYLQPNQTMLSGVTLKRVRRGHLEYTENDGKTSAAGDLPRTALGSIQSSPSPVGGTNGSDNSMVMIWIIMLAYAMLHNVFKSLCTKFSQYKSS